MISTCNVSDHDSRVQGSIDSLGASNAVVVIMSDRDEDENGTRIQCQLELPLPPHGNRLSYDSLKQLILEVT